MSTSPEQTVVDYHDRTKHRMDGYAKGPDTLDWDDQPDPFRCFAGAERVELPLLADQLTLPFADLSADAPITCQALTLDSLATLLEMSVALSAWKHYGTARWSLRVNPSSGNLHPTETYIVAQGIEGLQDGVYHYRADLHALERRCEFASPTAEPSLYIGFSSVHWREAWKYGERAFRYCQHDVGHAMAAVSYGAATMGWTLQPQLVLGDDDLAAVLGLDREADFGRAEREHPDVLLRIDVPTSEVSSVPISDLVSLSRQGVWFGTANILDSKHLYSWPVIDEVAEASHRPHQPAWSAATETDNSTLTLCWQASALFSSLQPALNLPQSWFADVALRSRSMALR